MKKGIIILFLVSSYCQAGNMTAILSQSARLSDDDTYHTGSWNGYQIAYQHKNVYLFIADESIKVSPMGNNWNYEIQGFGVGIRHKLSKTINIYAQAGYRKVSNSWGGRRRIEGSPQGESCIYYLNQRYWNGSTQAFHECSVDNENTLSGTIGIEIIEPITNQLDIGFSFSYRAMKIKETIRGYNDAWNFDKTGDNWQYGISRDYSSLNLGIVANYKF